LGLETGEDDLESILLLSFSGYLTSNIDERAVLGI